MQGRTTLLIEPDHPAFAGHFPGTPILPGVVLLDAVIHVVTEARRASSAVASGTCQIQSAKFLSPVGPGETLTISHETSTSGSTRFEVLSGSRKIATGTIAWTAQP